MPLVVDVVPLTRMPRGKDCFSYTANESQILPMRGALARIPFRNRIIDGIVWSMHQGETTMKLKPIVNVGQRAVLSQGQCSLLDRITQLYGGSRSTMIGPLMTIQNRIQEFGTEQRINPLPLPQILVVLMDQMRMWLETSATEHTIGQYLILAPTASIVEAVAQQLGNKGGDYLTYTVTPSTTTVQMRSIAQRVQTMLPTIIIGTRRSLLLPWTALRHVALIDEHHPAHRQWDLEPRIDNRVVAEWLSTYWGARYTLVSPIPSVQTYYHHPHALLPWSWQDTPLTPKTNAFACWNGSAHDQQQWVTWIRSRLEQNDAVTILCPDRFNGVIICKTCNTTQRCERCHRAFEIRSNDWWCDWCNINATTVVCLRCNGSNFKQTSSQTTSIKKTIEQYFPEDDIFIEKQESASNRTITIVQPSSVAAWVDEQRWITPSTNEHKRSILIWDLISSVATGYNQDETLLRTIVTARDAAWTHLSLHIGIINVPETLSFIGSNSEFVQWYEQELENRRSFRYPPTTSIVLLDTHDQVRNNTNIINALIQTLQTAVSDSAEIIGPITSLSRRKTYKQRVALIIRSKTDTSIDVLVHQVLGHIPVGWSITPNPELLPTTLSV